MSWQVNGFEGIVFYIALLIFQTRKKFNINNNYYIIKFEKLNLYTLGDNFKGTVVGAVI
jgi:hypothetical protein